MQRTLRKFEKNTQGRDFVVGDIHGCYRVLDALLNKIQFNPAKDRMFSVGDLADRGLNSAECLDYIRQPWFFPVIGNHELIPFYEDRKWHNDNGGLWFDALPLEKMREYLAAFQVLPWAIEVDTDQGRFGIVHAEVPDDDWSQLERMLTIPMESNTLLGPDKFEINIVWRKDMVKGRREFNGVKGIDYLCVGHVIIADPLRIHNVFCLDTGAYQSRSLTCVQIQGPTPLAFYSVPSSAC